MASTFLTLARPFTSHSTNLPSFSPQKPIGLKRNSLRINAISKKWEPTKVVPQADRVLIRLEELPEKSAGGVLLPKSAVKFERYLMGEVLSVGSDVAQVETGRRFFSLTSMLMRWIWELMQGIVSARKASCWLWLSEVFPAHLNFYDVRALSIVR